MTELVYFSHRNVEARYLICYTGDLVSYLLCLGLLRPSLLHLTQSQVGSQGTLLCHVSNAMTFIGYIELSLLNLCFKKESKFSFICKLSMNHWHSYENSLVETFSVF